MTLEIRDEIIWSFRESGFVYIAVDPQGYRKGSWNVAVGVFRGRDSDDLPTAQRREAR
jgi:hypothetical protein